MGVRYKLAALVMAAMSLLLASCGAAVQAPPVLLPENPRHVLVTAETIHPPGFNAPGFELAAQKGHLALYANMSTADIAVEDLRNGKIWYGNPPDAEEDSYAKTTYKNYVLSQLVVTTTNPATNTVMTRFSSASAAKRGHIAVEKMENGLQVSYEFSREGFTVPVKYFLTEDSFVAEVDTQLIQENGNEQVYKITLLPMFGAQSSRENGFILVPSGSGGQIDFNNPLGQGAAPYRVKIYGDDPMVPTVSRSNVQENQSLPVIGLQCGTDGILMIADRGASYGYINASVAKQVHGYNAACFDFETRISQNVMIGDPKSWNYKEVTAHEKGELSAGTVAVRYLFLDKDIQGISGMASVLKKYIEADRDIPGIVPETAPVFISALGSAEKRRSILGVRLDTVVPLTSVIDAQNIADELSSMGVSGIHMIYENWSRALLNYQIPDAVDLQSKLGSKKELLALSETLVKQGGALFLSSNFSYFRNDGNGVTKSKDSIRDINNAPSKQPLYAKNVFYPLNDAAEGRILNPQTSVKSLKRFLESKKDLSGIGTAVSDLTHILPSDLGSEKLRRETASGVIAAVFKEEAASQSIIGSNPNLYTLYGLSAAYNLPSSATEYTIVSRSVPFTQLVLRGLMPYASRPINKSGNYTDVFLRCIASASAPCYELMYHMPLSMKGLDQESYYGADYEKWKEIITKQYKQYKAVYDKTKGSEIISYETTAEGLLVTAYENGFRTAVNLTNNEKEFGLHTVSGKSFLLLHGEEVIPVE